MNASIVSTSLQTLLT
ncbi:hypothetical protein LEMLEM_LOCUS17129 [Lemmus lemmus]